MNQNNTLAFFHVANPMVDDTVKVISVPLSMIPLAASGDNGYVAAIKQEMEDALDALILERFNAATGRNNNPDCLIIDEVALDPKYKTHYSKPVGANLNPRSAHLYRTAEKGSVLTQWEPKGEWVFDPKMGRKVLSTDARFATLV